MAPIIRIDARIVTGNRLGAGTDGDVFIAIGGREFLVDSATNDFEQGSDRTYTFGLGANVLVPGSNDPRTPYALDTANLDRFPVWVRFEPDRGDRNTDWNLESVTITVNPGPGEVQYQALGGSDNLRLGQAFGKFCFLRRL